MAAPNILTTSGKWATKTNWSLGVVPTAAHDVIIPTGKEVKLETTAGKCRSFWVEKEGTWAGNIKLELGNGEKPGLEETPANKKAKYLLQIDAGAVVTFKGELVVTCTYTAEDVLVSVDKGITLKCETLQWKTKANAKVKLEEQLNLEKEITMGLAEEAHFNTNGKKVECSALSGGAAAKVVLELGASEIVFTKAGAFTAFTPPGGAEAVFKGENATLVAKAAENTLNLEGATYSKIKVEAASVTLHGGATATTLELVTKELAATKFQQGQTINVTNFIVDPAATLAKPVRMESTEATKAFTLHKASGNVNVTHIEVKDSTVDASPKWYGGAKTTESVYGTGNTNWLEEKEPAGGEPVAAKATGAVLLTGTAAGIGRAVVNGTATGAVVLTGTGKGALKAVVSGKASGAILLTGTGKGNVAGAVFGKATGTLILAGTALGTLRAVVAGKATGAVLLTGTGTGRRAQVVTGKATGAIVFTGTGKGSISGNIVGKASGAITLTGYANAGGTVVTYLYGPITTGHIDGPTAGRAVEPPGVAAAAGHSVDVAPGRDVGVTTKGPR